MRIIIGCLALVAGTCFAASVQIPGGSLSVSGTSAAGASFVYSGTLTEADTIAFTQSGNPCLQTAGTGYCVNGAGVLTVAATVGLTPVGGSSTFAGPSGIIPAGTWTYGALLMQISGVGTVQVFPTNAAHGLGSATPPASLTLPATPLSALGFPAFAQTNPTITFVLADTNFADNGGTFALAQPLSTPVPTLGEWGVVALALLVAVLGAILARRRSAA
jgi:hypothetical protein